MFYIWRVTRDEQCTPWERGLRKPGGCNEGEWGAKLNTMETFWLGEALKYLFLLFDDEKILPIDGGIVFNTEAHSPPILG